VVFGYTLLYVLFFAPVLFSSYLLAPGDGILYFLPNFYARRALWDVSVWGGFPAVGDSQLMMWYPPALLFSLLNSWNAFLLSAYVLAASFAYAYAYALTRSRFAATIGGVCYGMCGFFIAHLGHAALIHAAAWLPLFLLSLEKLAVPDIDAERDTGAGGVQRADSSGERDTHSGRERDTDSSRERDTGSDVLRREDASGTLLEDASTTSRQNAGGMSQCDAGGALSEDAAGVLSEGVRGGSSEDVNGGSSEDVGVVGRGNADVAWYAWARRVRRARANSFWYAVGVLSVACSALAGHPQIFVYMLSLGGAYALVRGWRAGKGRVRYYFLSALLVLNGTAIAAIQLLPTAELAARSLRASLGFAEFVSYALPPRQAPMLLFPYLYGGSPGTLYDLPYFGAWGSEAGGWGAGELSGYVGLLTLLLAAIGFFATKRRALAQFWLATCVVAFLLALGEATPLAHLTYQLPFINKFRVPARHFMELSFAASVLAALGAHAVLERAASRRLLKRTLAFAACVMLACLCAVVALTGQLNAAASASTRRPLSFLPWANPATGVPLLVLLAGAAALAYWYRCPHSFARGALLLSVLALDLASFSWFYEWHYGAPYKVFQTPPVSAVPLRDELAATHARLLPVRGGTGRVSEIPPDLSKLWGFPSASGYGPFILTRVSRLLTMPPHGSVADAWRDPANLGLDVMAVRYLFVPRAQIDPPTTTDAGGIEWTQGDFNVSLGSGCGAANPDSFAVELPQPARANVVAVATALACSAAVADQTEVARLVVTDTRGQTHTASLLAGRDTSEWAYDCADVRPTLRQSRANVYRSYPVTRPGDVRCEGHDYAARLSLPASVLVRRIEIQWTGGAAATLSLKKISLLDESEGRSVAVVPVAGSLSDSTRWRHVSDINFENSGYGRVKPEDVGEASVYENLRARPRAWLVGTVLTVSEEEALGALHTSRLADGSAFDPAQVALIEEPPDSNARGLAPGATAKGVDAGATAKGVDAGAMAKGVDAGATARVTHLSDSRMEVETTASAPAFLVTSDVFYPGWEATVDGAPARLVRANYALRGLAVPAGTHTVRFEFRPRSFYRGAYVSAAALLLLAATVLRMNRKATRRARSGRGAK